ncbi:MAG: addiction module protein [Candidatus Hydrogenedens sp.]|nr:addiction module protein [Candidatus Hydrogenedens sp.]
MDLPKPSVFDLSAAEKLQLVEDLWDDLASDSSAVPIHEWQREEVARRRVNLERFPASAISWGELKRRALAVAGSPDPATPLTDRSPILP